MSQPSSVNQQPLFRQSWKSFVAKSWRMLFVMFLLALCLLLSQGVARAATNAPETTSHAHRAAYCNYRTYSLVGTLRLVSNSDGTVYDFQASNMNGQYTVRIWVNEVFEGEYYLPAYYDNDQIYVFVGNNGYETVDACLD